MMSNEEKLLLAALRLAPKHELDGVIVVQGLDTQQVTDAAIALKRKGRVDAKFAPNPNYRDGEQLGWIALRV